MYKSFSIKSTTAETLLTIINTFFYATWIIFYELDVINDRFKIIKIKKIQKFFPYRTFQLNEYLRVKFSLN